MILAWVNRSARTGGGYAVAGVIDRAAERRFVFTYDRKCESHSAVSLTMPVEMESYLYDDLHLKLMVNLLPTPEQDLRRSHVVKTIYDSACGKIDVRELA